MNTRWLAARILTKVTQDGQSLTSALDALLPNVASAQDRAFVQALCYGVCRYYHRLDFILNALVAKPIKSAEIKALVLIGLYQLEFMRVKPHAAVSETVLAARQHTWAKALINGVLRNYLRNKITLIEQLTTNKPALFSHPNWLIKQFNHDWPEHAATLLEENNQSPPMVLRVNQQKTNRAAYLGLLADAEIVAEAMPHNPDGIMLVKPVTVERLPQFSEGWVAVQDGAAQLAAYLLEVQRGQRVLDVCAAPGGKTAHILEIQPDLQSLVAVDIDENRLQRVRDNLLRLNLTATLIAGDALNPQEWWDGELFDRILLDAPCSATGVIRRHPDIKLLRKPQDIAAITELQKNILDAIWPLLAPGGVLLYSTCSVLKQENVNQVMDFLARHDDARQLPITPVVGQQVDGGGLQILTGESAMDGFFYARITKQ
jgi:16S rRNA (cytosine967-C5)-methyltransferase